MSFGGKFDYAKEYAKYKPNQPDSIFEQYVEDTPDLLDAWNKIQSKPEGEQASYWKPRGATSKAAFGRAHAAESGALKSGTYHGGTDVKPSKGNTRFESFLDTLSDTPVVEVEEPARPGFNPYLGDNPSFPLLDTAYSSPSAPSWAQGGGGLIPDAYAPWVNSGDIPDNIWQGEGPVQGLGYGVTHTAPATGLINIPAEESSTSGMNTTTDTSGKQWVMSPGGQWYPAGSDYANALKAGNAGDPNMYDSSGAFMGAEGDQGRSIMRATGDMDSSGAYGMVYVDDESPVPSSHFGTPWQDTPAAGWISKNWGINPANPYGHVDEVVNEITATALPTGWNSGT